MQKLDITEEEEATLIKVLIKNGKLDTSNSRKQFVDDLGFTIIGLSGKINLNDDNENFFKELIRECQRFGLLPTMGRPALIMVLEWLSKELEGHPKDKDKAFVDELIKRRAVPYWAPWIGWLWCILFIGVVVVGLIATIGNEMFATDSVDAERITPTSLLTPTETEPTLTVTIMPTFPTTIPPPPTIRADLGVWFVNVAEGNFDVRTLREALMDAEQITDANAWDSTKDLTGDGFDDWVITLGADPKTEDPQPSNCNNLYIVDPQKNQLLRDVAEVEGNFVFVAVQRIDDLSGDAFNDVLYAVYPSCEIDARRYELFTFDNSSVSAVLSSNVYAYPRLLLANDLFEERDYVSAAGEYDAILDTMMKSTGWNNDDQEELESIRKFASARKYIVHCIVDGCADECRVDGEIPSIFIFTPIPPTPRPFPTLPPPPLNDEVTANLAFCLSYRRDPDNPEKRENLVEACEAYESQISYPDSFISPLNRMGRVPLTWNDVCPFN